jgi:nucleotide-binding universal stress UspA family protein
LITLVHDGTASGDWVARYATRLALHAPERALAVVHVASDGTLPGPVTERMEHLAWLCDHLGVALGRRVVVARGPVADVLLEVLPRGPAHHVVCGTRTRGRGHGLLAGTVAERLLRARPCHVLAVHVMQPGLLGVPREVLVPVAGHPRGLAAGLPFLRLMAPDLERVDVLRVVTVGRRRYRHLTGAQGGALVAHGRAYVDRVVAELRAELGLPEPAVGGVVVVSDDWPKEIVIRASQIRARLVYLGASERGLGHRFFHGNPMEQVLLNAPCDVAICAAARG